jgi:hypothetical protein
MIIAALFMLLPCSVHADAGYALQFDEVDDYLDMADNYSFQDTSFTIEFWLLTSQLYNGVILGKCYNFGSSGYIIELNRTSDKLSFYRGTGSGYSWLTSNLSVNDSTWHHIACVYSHTANTRSIYIDGFLDITGSGNTIGITTAPFMIGNNLVNNAFGGNLDEVRIWDFAKTETEIRQTMRLELEGDESGLIGYWDFNEGIGDTAFDGSTSGINGQLGNSAGPDTADPLWFISNAPLSTTWHVSITGDDITGDGSESNPFRTIQHAIDTAIDYDTVLVWPGIYREHINYLGKALVVTSQTGAESTIIEKQFDGISMVCFENGEDSASVLSGFTVKGASATGIRCYSSSPQIIQCIIEHNHKDLYDELQGGGISIIQHSAPIIKSNIVRYNDASVSNIGGYRRGGGIFIYNSYNNPVIVDANIIYGNIANRGGAVGGRTFTIKMKNNIIFDNIDFSYGGTVFLNDVHNSILSNNTIAENISSQNSGSIYISGGSSDVSIFNNIITYNNQYGLYVTTSTNISVNYNCIFGNISGDIYGIAPGNGNIYVAPQFLSPENEDYSLLGSSPCIDTGDPSSPYDPDSTRADMGALYFDQTYRILNFHLIDPANDTVVVDTIQAFIWHSTEDIDSGYVVSYNLIWDDDPTFNYPDSTGTQPDTIYVLSDSLNRSTRYYWRVLASNGHAVPIYSDETWNFYIDGYPTSPQILGPENGTEADSSTYLSWIIGNDPDPMDTVTYTLQADDDTLFVSPEIDVSGITDSGVILDEAVAVQLGDLPGFENLQVGQVYYWRVRSNDLFGLSSAFTDGSTYFSLGENINDPPHPPDSGFSPSNYEEVISLTPTITWNAASDPDPDDPPSTLQYIFWLFSDTSTGCGFEYWDTTAAGIVQVTVADTMPDNCLWIYFVKTVDEIIIITRLNRFRCIRPIPIIPGW